MLVEFQKGDTRVLVIALALAAKVAENAKKQLERLGCPAMEAQELLTDLENAAVWVTDNGDPDEGGELSGEINIQPWIDTVFRASLSIYLEELTKVADKQTKLFVESTDTNGRADHVRNLVDRLKGQLTLGGPAFTEAVADEMRKAGYDVSVEGSTVKATAAA